jgi:hypothetical protein
MAKRRAAAPRDHRLIGALASKILRGAEGRDRFTGPRKPLHSNHAIDRGVANHMDHLAPLSTTVAPSARAMLGGENPSRILDQDVVDRALVHAMALQARHEMLENIAIAKPTVPHEHHLQKHVL